MQGKVEKPTFKPTLRSQVQPIQNWSLKFALCATIDADADADADADRSFKIPVEINAWGVMVFAAQHGSAVCLASSIGRAVDS